MEHAALLPLAAWENFYVIVGSSAAALTGLQFIVIVLGAEVNAKSSSMVTRAFGTPTIVHFCAVLLLSAMMSAPWPAPSDIALALGLCGGIGIVYGLFVIWHAIRQTDYEMVLEDWLFHCAFPLLGYGLLLAAAIELPRYPLLSLFLVAGIALLLLFVGIHNAWDSVTYIATVRRPKPDEPAKPHQPPAKPRR
jgi:hypothetical protein